MRRYTLLTGATGLVGRYLLRDLLAAGEDLVVVVRPSTKRSPTERVEEILQFWESQTGSRLPRPIVITGDVAQPGLGLSTSDRHLVEACCDRVIHNAARLVFHSANRTDEPWITNVEGTDHLLDFCQEARIRKMHYVSTAYVAGRQVRRVYEADLDCGQTFRNDYEESKFLAEKAMRSANFLDELTIYRPAVIAGDSMTGYTNTYHGVYVYLRIMAMIVPQQPKLPDGRHHAPVRLQLTGDELRNIVPVDWVSEAITHIFRRPSHHGLTYHLAPEVPMTPRVMIDACDEYFHSTGVTFCGPDWRPPVSELNWLERFVREGTQTYEEYDVTDPTFDRTNVDHLDGLSSCPLIDAAMIHRYLDFAQADRWGKRRPQRPRLPYSVQEVIEESRLQGNAEIWERALGHRLNGTLHHGGQIGLNVLGPGGGHWTVEFQHGRCVAWEPGLSRVDSVLLCDAAEFDPTPVS